MYPIRRCSRADFSESPQTVVALAPEVGPLEKHGVALSAKPIGVGYAAIVGCQKPLVFTPRKLLLSRAYAHPAVLAVGLEVLVRRAGPVAQKFAARELKAPFSFQARSGESCPMRIVHRHDGAISTSNRLVSGNSLQFESLKRGRNVVLDDVVLGGFLGEVVEHVLREPRRLMIRHLATFVGVGTELVALNRYAPASISAAHIGRKIPIQELSPER